MSLGRDFRLALRSLSRNRGFAAVCLFTLALGSGASTAIFTVVKSVLIEPLPYRDAPRIVAVQTDWLKSGRPGPVWGPDDRDLRRMSNPWESSARVLRDE